MRFLIPDADLLVLVGQVHSSGVVVSLDGGRGLAVVVLGAAGRGKVLKVTRVLGNLERDRRLD